MTSTAQDRSPQPGAPRSGAELAAWNEEMVARYDIERYYERSHRLVRWLEARRLAVVRSLAAPAAGETVLEVGCGAGHVLERFAGARRIGLDLSESMLGRTRRRLGAAVPLVRASADALPFADASCALVVCTEVLEHTPQPGAVVRELARVAGPAGRIVVSVPNEDLIDQVKRALRRVPVLRRMLRTLADEGNEWHLQRMNLESLRRITAGVARIERVQGLPWAALPLRYAARLRALDHGSRP